MFRRIFRFRRRCAGELGVGRSSVRILTPSVKYTTRYLFQEAALYWDGKSKTHPCLYPGVKFLFSGIVRQRGIGNKW